MRIPVYILAACMLLTGSIFTICIKIQDNTVVGQDTKGRPLTFKHPAVQTAFMFVGESLCLIPWLVRRWWMRYSGQHGELSEEEKALHDKRTRKSFWLFMLPAACDAGATTLLNLGLYYTYASVFQMLRGTLVIFAGLLTIVLLKRQLYSHHWLGMVLITAGAALVGASSILYTAEAPTGGSSGNVRHLLMLEGKPSSVPSAAPNPLLGDVLVVVAQLLAATQFIVEEKFLSKYHAPVLMAVGMEGFWGVVISAAALPLLGHVRGPDGLPLDSLGDAMQEIASNWTLQWTTAITIASIGLFNFFGVSVTKNLSGASRATIDACRTLFIWLFSLRAGWEHFHMLQVVGFVVLISGTSVYNEILRTCLPSAPHRRRRRHRRRQAEAGAEGGLEEGTLQQPLLGDGGGAALKQQQQQPGGEPAPAPARAAAVRFAPGTAAEPGSGRPPLPARPRPIRDTERYTMARSITILPAALSPHSLASLPPGFSYSDSLASAPGLASSYMTSSYASLGELGGSPDEGGGMGRGGEGLGAAGVGESESEFSESDVGEMSGHGGGRAFDRLRRSTLGRGGRPAPGEESDA